ncbi:protein-glutamine gamma-glutamyltransferase [Paenibacillus sp. OSY-SE]|uniref:protein-glutamine gamma-glutamyltransferase n=1 Tax=Paenibacillus sp. OSY-SE TaxID=1196323 RepID=UPI000314AE65|nr:protein-glutamine gamma-glutamyltransferase [Paenibacillus sp. OSY-SE]
MIIISDSDVEQVNKVTLSDVEREILQKKKASPVIYRYDSPEALEFELKMRSKIVKSATDLDASGVRFATFKGSQCNKRYWSRTKNGGFGLKSGVLPSDGINDIFQNGYLYAFECATAVVIILYKAVFDAIHKEAFNTYFTELFLWGWNVDSNLRLISVNNKNEAYLGDILYFENPDHLPETPEWQGENTVMLANDQYYGHGIGIETSEGIISALNSKRKPGSMTSAYLSERVLHPDFQSLQKLSVRGNPLAVQNKYSVNAIVARVGANTYIY